MAMQHCKVWYKTHCKKPNDLQMKKKIENKVLLLSMYMFPLKNNIE